MTLAPLPHIEIDHATLRRPGGPIVLRDLSWTIREGETWAFVGSNGSGKTSLAEALAGRMTVDAGSITWPFIERLKAAGRVVNWPSQVIHRVSFKEESRLFSYSRHYYQQRFNFIEPEDDLTLDQFIRAGANAPDDEIERVCTALGLQTLRELSLIKLSNGQTRRARLARALLSRPEMLLLDEPFMGLDTEGRAEVADMLGRLVRHGLRLILITPREMIPDWVTNVLDLDVVGERSRSEIPIERPLDDRTTASAKMRDPARLVELRNISVAYGERNILKNVSWTVREGERWALVGPNGSGKTTLLSLIAGDHPQAYSNDVTLFGRKRGTGESIWDVKRSIGLLSPEIHLYFTEPLSAFRAAATGYFDVLAPRPTTPEQDARLREYFDHFGIAEKAEQLFVRLSTGEQRLVLLIRALVKEPPLLILDEPFQGLDARSIDRLRHWLDERLRPDQALIFVSHLPNEIPSRVDRVLRLRNGCVVE